MSSNEDGDLESAPTERPATRGVLMIRDTWTKNPEPVWFSSLIEATAEPPVTPFAVVVGGGLLLATSSEESAIWILTPAGRDRSADEAHATVARDRDHVLSILLADDFAMAGGE